MRKASSTPSLLRIARLARAIGAPLVTGAGFSVAPLAFAEDTQRYSIAPGPLAEVLGVFAAQAGVNLPINPGLTADLQSPGLQGEWSTAQGFEKLLQGTRLQAVQQGAKTYTLGLRATASGALQLDSTNIDGAWSRDSGDDGLLNDYAASRSVVGTKTNTALRDIPQAIQVVTRKVIEDQQVTSLGDALTNVSGIQRGNSHGATTESFYVRGFLATTYAIDGIMTNSQVVRPEVLNDLSNIERVEVLKGPASVLYGRGNPGGLINLVTRKPTFTPTAEVKAQAGSWDFYRLQGYFSSALDPAETLAGGVAIAWQTDDGYRNTFHDSTRKYIAPTLRFQPNDSTTVDLGFEYTELSGPYDRGLLVIGDRVDTRSRLVLEEAMSRSETDKAALWLRVEHQVNDWLTVRQALRADESRKDFQNINFQGLQADGRTLNRRATDYSEDLSSITSQSEAVANFNALGVEHTGLVGYEYASGRREARTYRATMAPIDIYAPVYGSQPGPFISNGIQRQKMQAHSIYVQDQITLNDQWKILAGARWDSIKQEMTSIAGNGTRAAPVDLDPEAVSPRLGVVYQPLEWLALYASYSRSFSPQTDRPRGGGVLDPETGKQYEVGAKFDLIPDRLSATLALFEITRQNVAATDPIDELYSVQTGEQRVRGVELDVSGEPLDGWNIIGNISVVNAELTKDTTLEVGNKLEAVPTVGGSLWSTYQLQTGNLQGLGFGAGAVFAGKRYGDIDNSYSASGYVRFDASVFYDINEKMRIALNGQNLTDARYIETISSANSFAGEPASVTASLSAKF